MTQNTITHTSRPPSAIPPAPKVPFLHWSPMEGPERNKRHFALAPDLGYFTIERAGYRQHWDVRLNGNMQIGHANSLEDAEWVAWGWYCTVWQALDQERRRNPPPLPPALVEHIRALAALVGPGGRQ